METTELIIRKTIVPRTPSKNFSLSAETIRTGVQLILFFIAISLLIIGSWWNVPAFVLLTGLLIYRFLYPIFQLDFDFDPDDEFLKEIIRELEGK